MSQEDWLKWVKSQEFKDVSFWEFLQATTAEIDEQNQDITYFFDGNGTLQLHWQPTKSQTEL